MATSTIRSSGGWSTDGVAEAPLTAGGCTSSTLIGKVQVAVGWPVRVEVPVQVSEPGPTGRTEPEGGAQAIVPQLPVTPGYGTPTRALHWSGSLARLMGAGQASEHGWWQHTASVVVMVRLQPPAMLPTSPPKSSTA